jgi:hypothetical protein
MWYHFAVLPSPPAQWIFAQWLGGQGSNFAVRQPQNSGRLSSLLLFSGNSYMIYSSFHYY